LQGQIRAGYVRPEDHIPGHDVSYHDIVDLYVQRKRVHDESGEVNGNTGTFPKLRKNPDPDLVPEKFAPREPINTRRGGSHRNEENQIPQGSTPLQRGAGFFRGSSPRFVRIYHSNPFNVSP